MTGWARPLTAIERQARATAIERRRLERQADAFAALLAWILLRSERQHHWAVNE